MDVDKHLLKHLRREASGLGILLAGMVGAEESRQAARQRETRAVGEFEYRARRKILPLQSFHSQVSLKCDSAQNEDGAKPSEQPQFRFQG